MAKINNPVELARKISGEYLAVYGTDLVSVVLYGSAAGGDFNPARSDINTLVVLSQVTLAAVERSINVQNRYLKQRCPRPLFMDKAYIAGSLDSFPIEFLNMRGCYNVLHGEDVLAQLEISRTDLRLEAERELKGKRLHLIQNWLDVHRSASQVLALAALSLRDFGSIFRALLKLKEIEIPRDRSALFTEVEKAYALAGAPLSGMLAAATAGNGKETIARFEAYAEAVTQLALAIDTIQP